MLSTTNWVSKDFSLDKVQETSSVLLSTTNRSQAMFTSFWVIQCVGDLFGAFVNDESIVPVGNASLFFGVACTKVVCFATIPDICLVPLPVLAQHSYQTSLSDWDCQWPWYRYSKIQADKM